MNGFKKMIAAALIAGTALTSAAKAQDTTVSIEATTPAKGAAADTLFTSDYRTTVNHGKWTLNLEQNREGSFKGGTDFAALDYATNVGGWDTVASVGVDMHETSEDVPWAALYAGKTLSTGRINLVGVTANDGFRLLRGWYGTKRTDVGVGMKVFDADLDTRVFDYVAGVHTAKGDAGVWGSRTSDGKYGYAFTLDKPDFGLVGFGQHDPETDNGFGVMQAAYGSDGKRMGGVFTAGLFAARVTGNQKPHPYLAPMPSYLGSGGAYGAEIIYNRDDRGAYTQGQVGGKLARFANGVEVYAGAGVRTHETEGLDPVVEGLVRIPIKGLTLDIETRAAPETVVSVRMGGRF